MKQEDIPNMERFAEIGFNLKDVPYEDGPDWKLYFLCGGNQVRVSGDILQLNKYLDIAQGLCPSLGPNRIDPEKFVYTRQQKSINNFIFLRATPCTPTGKPSKYPLVVYFNHQMLSMVESNNDQVFGEMQYLQTGSIGAAKIIQWYRGSLKIVALGIKNNELMISSIESSENGRRIKLWSWR